LLATGGSGSEAFTVNTSDLGTIFNNTACVPGVWTLAVTQSSGGNPVVTETMGPISLVDLTAVCTIAGQGNGYTPPTYTAPGVAPGPYSNGQCLVQQGLGVQVVGENLTVTEVQSSSNDGLDGALPVGTSNPSAILVNLSTVTLGAGVFQAGQGVLNTVEVNDSRGTLTGWTVTGILESDFVGPTVGNDHTIPADYLTWNPSVSLTFPGDLAAGVVPFGTVAPPVYGPDACAAGSAATGTNSNIICPTVNDNAGSANPAGVTNNGEGYSPHATDPLWPGLTNGSEGPSGLINEVHAGPIANLGTWDTNEPDFNTEPAQVLCQAASGGGGGAFNCDASLSLAVPPYVAAGHYTATMDILTTAT
jgi:hypothetical protein